MHRNASHAQGGDTGQIGGNLRFNLANKVYKDKIMFLFAGIGGGYLKTEYYTFGSTDVKSTMGIYEVVLGVEHPNFKGFGYWTYAVTYRHINETLDDHDGWEPLGRPEPNRMSFKWEYHYHF